MMAVNQDQRSGAARRRLVIGGMFAVASIAGCSVQLPSLFPFGDAFIAKGTFELRTAPGGGECPAWVDTNRTVYQLFQGADVSNADFDNITTPGVTSRLRLVKRDDLTVGCSVGIIVEVQEVLEIVPWTP